MYMTTVSIDTEREREREREREMSEKGRGQAIVVGGSIAGVCCSHALIRAGWHVSVIEKSVQPPTGSPTGAGLGLDPLSRQLVQSWLGGQSDPLQDATISLSVDQNQTTDNEKKRSQTLTRDENFNFRAAHWTDLHSLLYNALPPDIFLWGHQFLSFTTSSDKNFVNVQMKVYGTGEIKEIGANLLVAADGCLSSIRKSFLPDVRLRYSGYCAWRGVLDFSKIEDSDEILGIRKAYPDLGTCLYFDLGYKTHCVFYELLNKRMNWIWYINQPEPELKGKSLTIKVSKSMIEEMHKEAEKFWLPELVQLMKKTEDPFINVIYDCDPLEKIFWDNVVLIGDAAHPSTPHGLRSTNMSILDAAVLGKCLEKWGLDDLHSALEEYQETRVGVTSKQVLHSRRLGRIKQGLGITDCNDFDPENATLEECEDLKQTNMPFFDHVPSILHLKNSVLDGLSLQNVSPLKLYTKGCSGNCGSGLKKF